MEFGGIQRPAVLCGADRLIKTCAWLDWTRSKASPGGRAAREQPCRFRGQMIQTNAIQRVFHRWDEASIFPLAEGCFDLDQTPGQQKKNASCSLRRFRRGNSIGGSIGRTRNRRCWNLSPRAREVATDSSCGSKTTVPTILLGLLSRPNDIYQEPNSSPWPGLYNCKPRPQRFVDPSFFFGDAIVCPLPQPALGFHA